tara:strand:- start:320 stop:733 length:414 start_codon:yes stop_codon:yes gene_type:complete
MQQLVFPFYQKILDEEAHQERLNKIPYFIRQRGCINCDVYATFREEGFSHETIVACVIYSCRHINFPEKATGYDYLNPFIDPEEFMEKARDPKVQEEYPDAMENAIAYARKIFEIFGEDYEYLGVSLTDIIGEQATA